MVGRAAGACQCFHRPPPPQPPPPPPLLLLQSEGGVLLTTYETMRLQRAELLGVEWGYVVLDEGHKIR